MRSLFAIVALFLASSAFAEDTGSMPAGFVRLSHVILCSTQQEQDILWRARQKSEEQFWKAMDEQKGCVFLIELIATPPTPVATYGFESANGRRLAIVSQVELRSGGSPVFVADVVPGGPAASL